MAESARGREDSGKIDLKSLLSEMNEEETTKPDNQSLESGVRLSPAQPRAETLIISGPASVPPQSAPEPKPEPYVDSSAKSSLDAKKTDAKKVDSKSDSSSDVTSTKKSAVSAKDEKAPESKKLEASAVDAKKVEPKKEEKKSSGTLLLFALGAGVICVGAYFGVNSMFRHKAPVASTPAPEITAIMPQPTVATPAPTASEQAAPVAATAEPATSASAAPKAHVAHKGPAPKGAATAEAPAEAKLDVNETAQANNGGAADFGEALRNAAGAKAGDDAKPVNNTTEEKRSTLRPSPGAVTGAINSVLPAARVCLGKDSPVVNAVIVFDGNGVGKARVTKGATEFSQGCIEDALSKARLPPFAEAPYSVNVTVRP